ncbi:MAG: amidohydrolase family protein [Planctomycetota bacterium]
MHTRHPQRLARSGLLSAAFVALLVLGLLLGGTRPAAAQNLAVHGDLVWTMTPGPGSTTPLRDAMVIVRDGKIVAIGPAASTPVPAGFERLRAAVVTPGLIDAHSVVGLAGYLNQPTDQDQRDESGPIQPELRAIDAYNAREPLIAWLRGFGITTIHTGHGPGALMTGETLIAKTRGDTMEQAVINPRAMIAATLGESALAPGGDDGGKSPGTRAKEVALLRAEFLKAQAWAAKRAAAGDDQSKAPDPDLRLAALADLLDRKLPLLVTAHRHHDLLNALRLAREFNLRLVLDGAAEAYEVLDEIRAAGVPVLAHAPMMRAEGEAENATMELTSRLREAGIPFALQSGFEDYVPKTRVVLYEAAIAARYGLSDGAALASITCDAASLLGLEARLGSLAAGLDGDLALFDGDPFEYTSHCIGTVIEGEVVSRAVR